MSEIPERIGPYRVLSKVGEGGMGVVYAKDDRLGRVVALKVIREFDGDPSRGRRFWQEARAAAQIALALLSALEAFHKIGIVHRDLKPGNIVISTSGTKLLDFGIAKNVDSNAEETATTVGLATMPGVFLGTPRYASPEQFRSQPVDARSDLFSMGAILFEMLTGQPPFPGESFGEIAHAVLHGSPPALSGSLAIAAMGRIVHRALSRDPRERYPSADGMAEELRATLLWRGSRRKSTRGRCRDSLFCPFECCGPAKTSSSWPTVCRRQ